MGKLQFITLVSVVNNRIKSSKIDYSGNITDETHQIIKEFKKPLYDFVNNKIIKQHQPGSIEIKIKTQIRERSKSRSIQFTVI